MNSALYEGIVRHRRREEPAREFSYRLFMAWLDLAELPQVLDGAWPLWSARRTALVSWHRGDYMGPADVPLDEAVRRRVEASTGRRPAGPVRMLTHLRFFGYCFNPVTFYYCYREDGTTLDAVVAEITNTPWNERHAYVLDAKDGLRFRFRKDFHVSPFLGMDFDHDWRFSVPGKSLVVHMDNLRRGAKAFDATLLCTRRELTRGQMLLALARHPFMTGKVVAGIYWQAALLALRRAPFYPHPVHHPDEARRAAELAASHRTDEGAA